ncbi:MAG: hypothetical protein Kow009_03290 [Spirochaetales bacterium]
MGMEVHPSHPARFPSLPSCGWLRWVRASLLALLLLDAGIRSFGQTILNEEFWYEYQPEVWGWNADELNNPIPDLQAFTREELFHRILEEARYVLSGMVYGYTFSYTPYDKSRKVEEEFLLEPYRWIQKGDPNLSVAGVRVEGSRMYVRIRYLLRDFQESWYQGLRSNLYPATSGEGEAPFYDGPEGRMKAIQEGVKNAIREYARTILYNKPRTLKGLIVLDAAPRLILESGLYKARIHRAILHLEEVKRYELH